MNSINWANVISLGSLIVAIISAIFSLRSNGISRTSNHISQLSLTCSTDQEKNEMAMQAINNFDNRVISKMYNPNITLEQLMNILTYINRWSPYVNDDIANRTIIIEVLRPYLLYVSRMLRPIVVDCYYYNHDYVSGYIQMMEHYFKGYTQNLGIVR